MFGNGGMDPWTGCYCFQTWVRGLAVIAAKKEGG